MACRAGDAICGALSLGSAASPAQAAFYAAASNLRKPNCSDDTLTVSLLFEKLPVGDLKGSYAAAAAKVLAGLVGVDASKVSWVAVAVNPAVKPVNTVSSAPQTVNATATTVNTTAAGHNATAAASTASQDWSNRHRRLLQVTNGTAGSAASSTTSDNSSLAMYLISAADKVAAEKALAAAAAANGQQLYSALSKGGVPFTPSLIVNGRPMLSNSPEGEVPIVDDGIDGHLGIGASPAATAAASSDPAQPASSDAVSSGSGGSGLDVGTLVGVVVGSVVGALALLALTCTACVALHKRRVRGWQSASKPRRYSDSAVQLPRSDCDDDESGTDSEERYRYVETLRQK